MLEDVTLLEVLLDEILEEEMMLVRMSEELLATVELVLLLVVLMELLVVSSWQATAIEITTAPRSNDLMSFFIFTSFLDVNARLKYYLFLKTKTRQTT